MTRAHSQYQVFGTFCLSPLLVAIALTAPNVVAGSLAEGSAGELKASISAS